MQTRQLSLVFSLLLTLCLFNDTQAQQAGRIESMKLLTPDVGWAATNKKLFWTTDGGAQWKDITPKSDHKRQMISSVFFLNASTGWVLLKCGDDRDVLADEGCFDLASTTDAGATWSTLHEKFFVPFSKEYLEDSTGFSGRSWLQFIDSQHGWELLDIATNSAVPSAGEMLRTVDGGKTWVPPKDTPTSDHFLFTTTTDGWIAGGQDQELFVTRDAGDSWQKVSLPKPSTVGPDTGIDYGLPVFENERHGLLPIRYAVGPLLGPDLSTVVLFVTDDNGRSWKQDRTLARVPNIYCSDIVGSTLIAVHSELRKEPAEAHGGAPKLELSLNALGPGQNVSSNRAEVFSYGAPVQLSFVSRDQGWANLLDGLFATPDGGRTWLEVTPGGARPSPSPAISAPAKAVPMQIGRGPRAGAPAQQPASGTSVSTHLGFDAYNVPTLSQMAAWSSSSPYYDIAIYLQGSKNGHTDPILGSANGPAWVSTVEGQGWGLIPAWVGLQSPCACYKTNTSTGKCTQAYPSVFSSNPGQDGKNEALAAVSAANALGVTTPIIYKDIENYYGPTLCTATQQAAAGAAVQAFVSGWDSQLHTSGYLAGVYGNPKPAQNDFSQAATIPDDVWITKTPGTGNPPSVTIWHLAPLTDGPWPNGQRIHQFLLNQANVTFGNVALKIDDDIDNATIANANNGAKTYSSFGYSAINIAGALEVFATGISDMWDGALINAAGETGQIVGYYYGSNTPDTGFLLDGLVGLTTFSCGLGGTVANGINNSGLVVGYWLNSTGTHGFQWNSGGSCTTTDYPGSTATYFLGINDAGQIVGYYTDSSGNHGFLYYRAKFYSIGAIPAGVNGDATIAGGTGEGFAEYAIPASWTGTFSTILFGTDYTSVSGTNNNSQFGGYFFDPSLLESESFILSNGVLFTTLPQYSGAEDTFLYSWNDFSQGAGCYELTSVSYCQGLAVVGQP